MTSYIQRLHEAREQITALRAAEEAAAAAERAREAEKAIDPWLPLLKEVRGSVDEYGVERITTQLLLELLDVPLHAKLSESKRLKRLMVILGWQPVRVFGLNIRGNKEQLRGFAKMPTARTKNARHLSATVGIDEQHVGVVLDG